MKKMMSVLLVVFLVTFAGNALAAISGAPCVECHTMHNSQDAAPMRWDGNEEPASALLRADKCAGCHADPNISNNGTNVKPQVDGTNYLQDTLAGGSFHWVRQGDDAKGHNVDELTDPDQLLGTTPPGWDPNHPGAVHRQSDWGDNQLTCSGTYGCHGDHTVLDRFGAVQGAHHEPPANDAANNGNGIDGSTVGKSYRFLLGVVGVEDSDWEFQATVTEHNVYKGVARNDGDSDTPDTISYLCAQCHGKFHSTDGNYIHATPSTTMSNPWLRHPTDIDLRVLPANSEYQKYGEGIGGYSIEAPVGLSNPVDPQSADYGAEAIVLCVSCHRPHGSPNDDLLRWDYAGMEAGITGPTANTGCFRCHTTKDGDTAL